MGDSTLTIVEAMRVLPERFPFAVQCRRDQDDLVERFLARHFPEGDAFRIGEDDVGYTRCSLTPGARYATLGDVHYFDDAAWASVFRLLFG